MSCNTTIQAAIASIPDHEPGWRLERVGKVVQWALVVHTKGHRAIAQLPALVHLQHLSGQHPQREPILHLQAHLQAGIQGSPDAQRVCKSAARKGAVARQILVGHGLTKRLASEVSNSYDRPTPRSNSGRSGALRDCPSFVCTDFSADWICCASLCTASAQPPTVICLYSASANCYSGMRHTTQIFLEISRELAVGAARCFRLV